jgi:hypothetical protein
LMPLLLLAAYSASAQQPPAPPENPGGWRRFDDQRTPAGRPASGANSTTDPATPVAAPPNEAPPPLPSTLTLPAGTWITIRVNQPLSSDHNQPGDAFSGTLSQPLVADGLIIARRGQTVGGRVAETEKAGRVKGTSKLGLELTELSLVDGQQKSVRTQWVVRRGSTSVGQDATAIGTTTGVGAAIGAAADGGFGAGMGAIAGAGASLIGVLVTRGRATEVYPETLLTFRLETPVTISTERSEMAFQPVQQADFEANNINHSRADRYDRGPRYGGYGYPGPYVYPPYFYGPSFFFYSGPRYYGRGGYRRW